MVGQALMNAVDDGVMYVTNFGGRAWQAPTASPRAGLWPPDQSPPERSRTGPQPPGLRDQALRLCHRQAFDPSALLRAGLRLPDVATYYHSLAKWRLVTYYLGKSILQELQHIRILPRRTDSAVRVSGPWMRMPWRVVSTRASRWNEHISSASDNCRMPPMLVLMPRHRDTPGNTDPQYHNYHCQYQPFHR